MVGEGDKSILIVGEAPDQKEDANHDSFGGEAGLLLRKTLTSLGVHLDKDCWRTHAVRCRPPKGRTPNGAEILCCRGNLFQVIEEKKPTVVVLLGNTAIQSLIGHTWKESPGPTTKWAGFIVPSQNPNAWIVPTYHPWQLLEEERNRGLALWFRKHLRSAIKKRHSKPWEKIPDLQKEIRIIHDPEEAARLLRQWILLGDDIAFDYETNCLKPEYKGARIYSCAVCTGGTKTIAFPWMGEVIEATQELLQSDCGKIAANLKFEDRWTQKILGVEVKNWKWDTMLAAHVLNNQAGVTGLKFQSYVQLGQPPYDDHIQPYLKDSAESKFNKINQINLTDLLLYNGMDALLEYKLAQIQMERISKLQTGKCHE